MAWFDRSPRGVRRTGPAVPPIPRWLGLAGLLPQFACVAALWLGPEEWRYAALAIGYGYAALIFSFLGGLWWGIAAGASARGAGAPQWLWFAAVAPSLVAFATYLPWVFGLHWPGPSLMALGLAILGSLAVDRRLSGREAPHWWLLLRMPLSLGLGFATILLAVG